MIKEGSWSGQKKVMSVGFAEAGDIIFMHFVLYSYFLVWGNTYTKITSSPILIPQSTRSIFTKIKPFVIWMHIPYIQCLYNKLMSCICILQLTKHDGNFGGWKMRQGGFDDHQHYISGRLYTNEKQSLIRIQITQLQISLMFYIEHVTKKGILTYGQPRSRQISLRMPLV